MKLPQRTRGVSCQWLVVSCLLLIAGSGLAQGSDPDLPSQAVLTMAEPFIVGFAKQYPAVLSILLALGAIRLVGKPIVAAWHFYCEQTDTPKDNEFLAKVEASKGWKVALFLIDWLGSIKVRK